LVKIDGNQYLKQIIEYVVKLLNSTTDLKNVTKEQFEIMNLPEGELYDKTLIESVIKQMQEAVGQTANLKKESKLYSYKEQLADAELRKELDKKKKKEIENQKFTLDEIRAKMTKKQQETLDLQIIKEKNIRDEMKTKHDLIKKVTLILVKAVEGGKFSDIKSYLSLIVRDLIKFVRSPLCIGSILHIFEAIANLFVQNKKKIPSVLYSKTFLNMVVHCSIRMTGTVTSGILASCWLDEPLDAAYKRICKLIKTNVQLEIERNNFDLSLCSFFYPLLRVRFYYYYNYYIFIIIIFLIIFSLAFFSNRQRTTVLKT
jgi:hypothetical protein